MVARVTAAEIDPVRQNPRRAIERFEAELIPALHEQDGYEGCYVLLSEEGKALVITLWSSEEAAHASNVSGLSVPDREAVRRGVLPRIAWSRGV